MMEEQRLRSDSAMARRIARSFVDFLRSVEVGPGKDPEALQVAVDCLRNVFCLDRDASDGPKDVLVDLFKDKVKSIVRFILFSFFFSDLRLEQLLSSSASEPEPSTSSDVYGEFIGGLQSAGFDAEADSTLRAARLAEARSVFEETLKRVDGSNRSELLAEAFKAQGNRAMTSRRYSEAMELYTLAISVCGNNAIYFANRAAAHTQAGNYNAAISDCRRALEINPLYGKAHSRLGLVFYSQGRYSDAVDSFRKALELDPSNASVSENLKNAQRKLDENRNGDQASASESNEVLRNLIPGILNFTAAADAASQSQQSNSDTEPTTEQCPTGQAPGSTSAEQESRPPFTDFVRAAMQGLAAGTDDFANNVGPEFANYVHLFGGLGRQSSPSIFTDEERIRIQSTASPAEFSQELQSALESVLSRSRGQSSQN